MKSMKGLLRTAAVGALVWMAAQPAAAQDAAEPASLTIGSFNQGSGWYVYAVNLAEVLRSVFPEGSRIDTPPIAGGLGNPRMVGEGQADFAFGMALVGNWAEEGDVVFDEPMPELRALVGGWDRYYLLPIASGVTDVTDPGELLEQERPEGTVMLLPRGSIGALGGAQLLEIAGAGEEALTERGGSYEFGSFDTVKSGFAGGTVDVFIHVANPGHPSITEIAQNNPTTFLEPSQETLDAMTEQYGWGQAVMPAGTFPNQENDIKLPSTTTTLFSSTDMSEDMAYTIVKAICENTDRLQAAHQALAGFDCEEDQVWSEEVRGLPLHPGAERYYREQGWIE